MSEGVCTCMCVCVHEGGVGELVCECEDKGKWVELVDEGKWEELVDEGKWETSVWVCVSAGEVMYG